MTEHIVTGAMYKTDPYGWVWLIANGPCGWGKDSHEAMDELEKVYGSMDYEIVDACLIKFKSHVPAGATITV